MDYCVEGNQSQAEVNNYVSAWPTFDHCRYYLSCRMVIFLDSITLPQIGFKQRSSRLWIQCLSICTGISIFFHSLGLERQMWKTQTFQYKSKPINLMWIGERGQYRTPRALCRKFEIFREILRLTKSQRLTCRNSCWQISLL